MNVTIPMVEAPAGALERGAVAVCIPVTTEPDLVYRCVHSVVAALPPDVPVVVVEDGGADPAIERLLDELERETRHVRLTDSPGHVALTNAGIAACGAADVVLVASHALVSGDWFERLREAARSDSIVGTASALGNNAGLVSVPGPYEPLPSDVSPEQLARDIAARSPRAVPRTPLAESHCVWLSRAALELVGPFDTAFSSSRAALIDFSQRCLRHGFLNVVADDVFVASVLPGLSARGGTLDLGEDRALLERRYPYLRRTVEDGPPLPLARSVSIARQSVSGVSVTVDARILRGELSGAQAATLELIEAICRTQAVRVRVLLDPGIGADASRELERVAPGVERLSTDAVGPDTSRTDLVHRPYQVTGRDDVDLLLGLGERLVITHLDLIAFHNPAYFESFGHWTQFRRVTRQALALADRVVFLSRHAADDAVREELVDPDRVRVVPMAVAGREFASASPRRPRGAPDGAFLLCIGNDFRHKNRLFAIKLLSELRTRGWEGSLVLAGAHVENGSSRGDEAVYLAPRPELAAHVHELAAVSESEKSWLYGNAAAIVYPTVYEGFGLIPFEAARAGLPCLFAAQSSLAEALPAESATLIPWDAGASAERTLPLLHDSEERGRHLAELSSAMERMPGWAEIVDRLLDVYEEAARSPLRPTGAIAGESRLQEERLAKWTGLEESMGQVVGPGAHLPPDIQRALLALVTRERLRRLLFALLRATYRLGYRARRR
jgi:glycosyltransferase involved in cell wall biosynthesis